MVADCKMVKEVYGQVSYDHVGDELVSGRSRRSLFAVRDITKGEVFTPDNVRSIRPGQGVKPKFLMELLGTNASRSYNFGEPIDVIELKGK